MESYISQLKNQAQQLAADLSRIEGRIRMVEVQLGAESHSASMLELCAEALAASKELSATADSMLRILHRRSAADHAVEFLKRLMDNDQDILDEVNVSIALGCPQGDPLRTLRAVLTKISQHTRTDNARSAAEARHNKGAKYDAKAFVRICWSEWRAGRSHYASTQAFAEDMLLKCPDDLRSDQVIGRWVRKWDKGEDCTMPAE